MLGAPGRLPCEGVINPKWVVSQGDQKATHTDNRPFYTEYNGTAYVDLRRMFL